MTSKKQKDSVLVAESSKVLSKLMCPALEKAGYDVTLVGDGLEAIKFCFEKKPLCVICDTDLPKLDGWQICSVIKDASEISGIPFILVTANDLKENDFTAENSYAEKVMSLNGENLDELLSSVQEMCAYRKDVLAAEAAELETAEAAESGKAAPKNAAPDKDKSAPGDDKTAPGDLATITAVKALDKNKSFFSLYTTLSDLYYYVDDIDSLIHNIFQLLYKVTSFDAATIILKDIPCMFYFAGLENMNEKDATDFRRICRTDFEKATGVSVGSSYTKHICKGIVENPKTTSDFKSYSCYNVEADQIIATIHIASDDKQIFSYKISSLIQFIVQKSVFLLYEALKIKHITFAETKLRSAFSKFVPEEIIDDMLKESDDESEEKGPSNEKRKVAILISDIRSFTNISEINKPENVVNFLNVYFSQMVDIIKKHGGSIDKFMGDAIMALFGAPISYVDNAKRAVAAAIEMSENLKNVHTELMQFPPGINFDIGIGIHYGEAIVGNIGCKEKTDYTVIGDTVNLASRLEGLTKHYGSRIIVSEAVKDEIGKEFNVMPVDIVKVKGKTQGVRIFRADSHPLSDEYVKNYTKGLDLYIEGAWKLAMGYFEEALKARGEDKSAKLMISRCQEFIKNPPENWNGAVALTSK